MIPNTTILIIIPSLRSQFDRKQRDLARNQTSLDLFWAATVGGSSLWQTLTVAVQEPQQRGMSLVFFSTPWKIQYDRTNVAHTRARCPLLLCKDTMTNQLRLAYVINTCFNINTSPEQVMSLIHERRQWYIILTNRYQPDLNQDRRILTTVWNSSKADKAGDIKLRGCPICTQQDPHNEVFSLPSLILSIPGIYYQS